MSVADTLEKKARIGLTSFQLKVIAVVLMTIDHIAAFDLVPFVLSSPMRTVGRIGTPLFLFVVVQSLKHTRSKLRYLIRLYAFGVLIEIINTLYSMVFFRGQFLVPGNMIPSFMYLAFFIICLESLFVTIKTKKYIQAIIPVLGILLPFIVGSFYLIVNLNHISDFYVISIWARVFAPNIFSVSYSFGFVLLGVFWYFFNRKATVCFALLLLSTASCFIDVSHVIGIMNFIPFNFFELFIGTQWCMVFAIPIILLYNGKKGASGKYFFYAYYPLHQYILLGLRMIIG